jgi:DNA invertase Pin-like site-specific DNA recombinase
VSDSRPATGRPQATRPATRPDTVSQSPSGGQSGDRGPSGTLAGWENASANARCSTTSQDLTAQREILAGLGVPDHRIYLDRGLTGTRRARPGLDQALAAVRAGDTLVVAKLDRLARSVPDARAIGDSLAARGVRLALGETVYDPTDPLGKMFFNILATFAEFEADLARTRTREGMAVARAKGRLKGKPPKLSRRQQAELVRMHATGDYTIADLMELFFVGRATVYRVLDRARTTSAEPAEHPA